jgi:hypothetical protein
MKGEKRRQKKKRNISDKRKKLRDNPRALESRGFRAAAENGHVEVVKELLKDSRVDPAADLNNAIYYSRFEKEKNQSRLSA